MTVAQTMWLVGGISALAAFALAFFLMFAVGKMSNRVLLSSAAFGLLLGYAVVLIAPDGATVTRTYIYNYSSHVDWTWIFCTPIVVAGVLVALWMRPRWAPPRDWHSQQLQHHQRGAGRELTVIKSLPPPAKRNPFEDWGRRDG